MVLRYYGIWVNGPVKYPNTLYPNTLASGNPVNNAFVISGD
jgi:hypothetical protein